MANVFIVDNVVIELPSVILVLGLYCKAR